MFYFKNITIDNPNPPVVEKAIRSFSLKRHTSLDFKTSSGYIGDEKYFLGLATEKELLITRLRTPFERVIPKIIVRFKKDQIHSYQVRYNLFSTVVFCLFILGLIENILSMTDEYYSIEDSVGFLLLFIVFLGLTLLEITLTRNRINKAIQKTNENEFLNAS